jgi:hypothetical protein
MGTEINISAILIEDTGLFFCKVAVCRYDMLSRDALDRLLPFKNLHRIHTFCDNDKSHGSESSVC